LLLILKMGKYEREKIELREKHLVSLLNGKEDIILKNKLSSKEIQINKVLATKLKKKFPMFDIATHIGNTYGISLGDIKFSSSKNNDELFIEVKFLKSGYGTRANISQDALTEYGIFENASHWSCFREKVGHDKWVLEKLLKFKYYKDTYESIKSLRPKICHMAKELKEFAKHNNRIGKESSKIKNEIIETDRQEKLNYIKYLSTQTVNYDNLRKFVILILTGNHTKAAFGRFRNINYYEIKIPDNYFIIYAYDNEEVYLENIKPIVLKVQDNKNTIDIEFNFEQTNIKIYIIFDNHKMYLLRVVFHWKNKFQGIETPCLNIFDEYPKTLIEL